MSKWRWLALMVLLISPGRGQEAVLSVAVESSLRNVMRALVVAWADENTKVELSVANSQVLRAHMEKGAAWDVIITADQESLILLAAAKKIAAEGQVKVARNRLVVFGRKPLTPDEEPDWFDLMPDEWARVALADPVQAVSGRAAQAALEKRKLWSIVKAKAKFTTNETLAVDFAKRNEVDAVMVYASAVAQVKIPGFRVYDLDPGDYPALGYTAALALNGPRKMAAQAFLDYLTGEPSQLIWEQWGFWSPK